MASKKRSAKTFRMQGIGSFALGIALWLLLVAAMGAAPLDRGEGQSGVYALLGMVTSYFDTDGKRQVQPARLSF